MSLPEPFRGEVWDVDFDDFGLHPAVVLSMNALNTRLGHVTVVPVTGTRGPDQADGVSRVLSRESTFQLRDKAAISLGHDTDTTACVAGGIAGISGRIPVAMRS